jgi:hypothetical protein
MAGCADRLVGWRQAFREDDFGGKAGRGSGFLRELKQPKVYAFDTGFVSYAWGWEPLRSEDYGILWEHLVLEHLQAHFADILWSEKTGKRACQASRETWVSRFLVVATIECACLRPAEAKTGCKTKKDLGSANWES